MTTLSMGGGGGITLFHTAQVNLGPDGPPPFKCWLCGSSLVDVWVVVGFLFVAGGRAGRGQVKKVAFIYLQSTRFQIQNSTKEIRLENCVQMCSIYSIIIKYCIYTFPIGDPPPTPQECFYGC